MDNSEKLIEQIALDKTQNKKIISLANKLVKQLRMTSKNDLENLTNLCYWLYIYDQKDRTVSLCKIVDRIPFENDYDIWTWVEITTMLHMRILREQNKIEEIEKYIPRIMQSYEGKEKLLRRLQNGSLLCDDRIKFFEEKNDEKGANAWRFSQIRALCKVRELGGSETYPIEIVDKEIDRLKTILADT